MIGVLLNALSIPEFPMSCLLPDGSLNEARWEWYCRKISDYAGHVHGKPSHVYVRVFPWLDWDTNMFGDNIPRDRNMKHFPWVFKNGKFDFELKNEQYYRNIEKVFRIANGCGVIVKWSWLDRCHGNNNNVPETPFLLNRNGINTFYDRKAQPFIKEYIRNILEIVQKYNFFVRWVIINEPKQGNMLLAPLTNLILDELLKAKIPLSHITSGKELFVFNSKGELVETGYTSWMRETKKRFNDNVKNGGKASLHGVQTMLLNAIAASEFRKKPGEIDEKDYWFNELFSHTRGVSICTDGSPQTKEWWETEFLNFLRKKSLKDRRFLKYMDFEATYFGSGPGYQTDLEEIKGIANCMHAYTGQWIAGGPPRENNEPDPGKDPPKKTIIVPEIKPPIEEPEEEKMKKKTGIFAWIKKRHRVLISALIGIGTLIFIFFMPRWSIIPWVFLNHLLWWIGVVKR